MTNEAIKGSLKLEQAGSLILKTKKKVVKNKCLTKFSTTNKLFYRTMWHNSCYVCVHQGIDIWMLTSYHQQLGNKGIIEKKTSYWDSWDNLNTNLEWLENQKALSRVKAKVVVQWILIKLTNNIYLQGCTNWNI